MEATIAQVLHMGLVDCHIADTAGTRCGDSNGSRDACLARDVLERTVSQARAMETFCIVSSDKDSVVARFHIKPLKRPTLVHRAARSIHSHSIHGKRPYTCSITYLGGNDSEIGVPF